MCVCVYGVGVALCTLTPSKQHTHHKTANYLNPGVLRESEGACGGHNKNPFLNFYSETLEVLCVGEKKKTELWSKPTISVFTAKLAKSVFTSKIGHKLAILHHVFVVHCIYIYIILFRIFYINSTT